MIARRPRRRQLFDIDWRAARRRRHDASVADIADEGDTGPARHADAPSGATNRNSFDDIVSTLGRMNLVVHLPDELARRVEQVAAARHQTPEQVAIDTIDAALPAAHRAPGRRLAFAGIGASESTRGGADADELLAEGFGRG